MGAGVKERRAEPPPRFVHNASRKFESRWSSVTILDSPSILLKGMAVSLGCLDRLWGRRGAFPDDSHRQLVESKNLAPIRYADDSGKATDAYPFCPNGAALSPAAACSPSRRHLAMMPHPERWCCSKAVALPAARSTRVCSDIAVAENAAGSLVRSSRLLVAPLSSLTSVCHAYSGYAVGRWLHAVEARLTARRRGSNSGRRPRCRIEGRPPLPCRQTNLSGSPWRQASVAPSPWFQTGLSAGIRATLRFRRVLRFICASELCTHRSGLRLRYETCYVAIFALPLISMNILAVDVDLRALAAASGSQ